MGNMFSKNKLLQSDLAGERSQFAAENKTASERTFVRFFSTKHGSLRITVGRWLPKETPIRSAPPAWEASTSSRSQGEVHHDGGTSFFSLPERMKYIGDHSFVAACSSDLRIRRGPQAPLS
jgi:CHASE1-domain containing sensor protein